MLAQQVPEDHAQRQRHGRVHRPAEPGATIGARDEQGQQHAGGGQQVGDAELAEL